MPDREMVIKGLTEISEYVRAKADIAGIGKGKELFDSWYRSVEDALALLREQEPQEPYYCEADDSWGCGNCGETVGYGEFNPGGIDPVRNKYCPECGRKVKWDA